MMAEMMSIPVWQFTLWSAAMVILGAFLAGITYWFEGDGYVVRESNCDGIHSSGSGAGVDSSGSGSDVDTPKQTELF